MSFDLTLVFPFSTGALPPNPGSDGSTRKKKEVMVESFLLPNFGHNVLIQLLLKIHFRH